MIGVLSGVYQETGVLGGPRKSWDFLGILLFQVNPNTNNVNNLVKIYRIDEFPEILCIPSIDAS